MVLNLIECGILFETATILTMLVPANKFILVQWLPRGVDGTLESTNFKKKNNSFQVMLGV